ncbi:hypothetical protein Dda_5254 [Drechslerella dactyloides]|uniref:Uncharacterized protein n=1 Tax=Drechslerella dactyloides TaxID=74499 RepID=A0AAD6NHD1_DREDA|nr:hypothetical protein Dda_5254 [Drechslerella dactyloides]
MPVTHTPPACEGSGLRAVFNYHEMGQRKLEKVRTIAELKRYLKTGLEYLQKEINIEIANVKACNYPMAKDLTFSNVDEYVSQAIVELNEGKQTLTRLRSLAPLHMRAILAIARDLEEEIMLVSLDPDMTEESLTMLAVVQEEEGLDAGGEEG